MPCCSPSSRRRRARVRSRPRSAVGCRPAPTEPAAAGASDAGTTYRAVIDLPPRAAQSAPVHTFALADAARYWRVRFGGMHAPLEILEARFHLGARIDRFEEKAGYGVPAPDEAP